MAEHRIASTWICKHCEKEYAYCENSICTEHMGEKCSYQLITDIWELSPNIFDVLKQSKENKVA